MPTRGGEGVRAPAMWWREGPSRRQDPTAATPGRAARAGAHTRGGKIGEGEPLTGGAAWHSTGTRSNEFDSNSNFKRI
jgi:hypothetical protein